MLAKDHMHHFHSTFSTDLFNVKILIIGVRIVEANVKVWPFMQDFKNTLEIANSFRFFKIKIFLWFKIDIILLLLLPVCRFEFSFDIYICS